MAEWIYFALTAYLFWTATNLISKVLVTKHIKNIFIYAIIGGFVALLPLLLIPFKGLIIPNASLLIVTIITGMLYTYASLPYLKALSMEEVSRVIPLWRFTPLFVLIFSVVFIGEKLGFYEIIAFFLLLSGGILISIRKVQDTFKISKAFYLMLFSSFLFGIYYTLTKFVYLNQAYYDGFLLIRAGSFIGALSLLSFRRYRKGLTETISLISTKVKGTILMNGVLNLIGLAFFNFAVSIASVSLVTATEGIQSIFVLIAASLLSFKFPELLKEKTNKRILLQKLIGIVSIIIGAGIIILY